MPDIHHNAEPGSQRTAFHGDNRGQRALTEVVRHTWPTTACVGYCSEDAETLKLAAQWGNVSSVSVRIANEKRCSSFNYTLLVWNNQAGVWQIKQCYAIINFKLYIVELSKIPKTRNHKFGFERQNIYLEPLLHPEICAFASIKGCTEIVV